MSTRPPNHLAREASPYLRQHAHNPVDWYPWGEEALRRARDEDKPILLSVGYAACHWCHVMAHESFEDPEIAAFMNDHFINVKVDREERPDLDAVYQTVCQMVTGQGGWPLTVFLTPELKPFFVGTYFPPRQRFGRPGFTDVLRTLAAAWREERAQIEAIAQRWVEALAEADRPHAPAAGGTDGAGPVPAGQGDDGLNLLRSMADDLLRIFDPRHGGFGRAPKFPNPANLELFLLAAALTGDRRPLDAARFTLRKMAEGGVYDQLGGGFHRYAVDAAWQVPHFEKMLYDSALLVPVYLDAHRVTGDPLFARVARETLDFLLREMISPDGVFYSSIDADSDGGEGRFYVWTPDEVRAAAPEDWELLCARYGVTPSGNFEGGSTVLHVAASVDDLAARYGLTAEVVGKRLELGRRRLFEARERRPRPPRHEQALAGWNGLALSALAHGWQVLQDRRYLDAAERAAAVLRDRMRPRPDRLLRRFHNGQADVEGTLEDYAYVAHGLVDVYESTFDAAWLVAAAELARGMVDRFWDSTARAFYLTEAGTSDLIHRPTAALDAGMPAPQSVAVATLLRLHPLTGDERFRAVAEAALEAHAGAMRRQSWGMASLGAAWARAATGGTEVTVAAPEGDRRAWGWWRQVWAAYLPARVLTWAPEDADAWAWRLTGSPDRLPPAWAGRPALEGRPTAYVCRNFACSVPLTDDAELARELSRAAFRADGA
ncbi:MAG: thioredoxin domain-containing protein [Clostridia bacterium]|nr:thioredoxin domain-containing protein [Clostridia bacterium]